MAGLNVGGSGSVERNAAVRLLIHEAPPELRQRALTHYLAYKAADGT